MEESSDIQKIQLWLKKLGKSFSIEELKNLKYLDLENNNLSELPKEIIELKNLKSLYIANNKRLKLPQNCSALAFVKFITFINSWYIGRKYCYIWRSLVVKRLKHRDFRYEVSAGDANRISYVMMNYYR